ncbi:hypothetical protein Tco_0785313 [Tanacetum coccineum]
MILKSSSNYFYYCAKLLLFGQCYVPMIAIMNVMRTIYARVPCELLCKDYLADYVASAGLEGFSRPKSILCGSILRDYGLELCFNYGFWMILDIARRSSTALRGGRTGGRTGRAGGRTGEPTGRIDGRTSKQDGQGGGRGNRANGGVNEVPDFSTVIAQ